MAANTVKSPSSPTHCFLFILAIGALSLVPASANAFCSEPSYYPGTSPSAPNEPPMPYCLSGYEYSHKHTCEDYEIDSYINEVNRYIRDMNDYSEEASKLAKEAITFANEANDFASCSVKQIKSKLE